MANKQLNIEGATAYAHEKALADESSNMSVSSLAVNKLARWELPPPPHPQLPEKLLKPLLAVGVMGTKIIVELLKSAEKPLNCL